MTASSAFKPMTKDDIADVLGVSLRTIENWVNDGTVPAPKKIGNRVYWHPDVFYAWLEHRLMADAADDATADITAVPRQPAVTKVGPKKAAAKPARIELAQLRSREQSRLEAMLA